MDTERLLEILLYNFEAISDKIDFYTAQGISQRKIDALQIRKTGYQQAILNLE